MALVRRFLVPSAFARVIRRERGVTSRVVEGHFPARPERSQFVRVEQDECFLVLQTRAEDGELRTEQTQVPASHAEALIDVAPGRVAFDRTVLPLGLGAEGWLDRLIVPSGLDVITVTISSDPRLFVPPLWFGQEVTGNTDFENGQIALNGLTSARPGEVSNEALEGLLDWVEGKSVYSFRASGHVGVGASLARETASSMPEVDVVTSVLDGELLPPVPEVVQAEQEAIGPDAEGEASSHEAGQDREKAPAPSDARDHRHGAPPRPPLRGEVAELDDRLSRLARSLAPRRFLPRSADPANLGAE
jgi:CYTH domain-containing protein